MTSHYIIRGGLEGRERLRVLSRVMHPMTMSLFDRVGLAPGMSCLDVGCGGGDVTAQLARLVAPGGRAMGLDLDKTKLDLARSEVVESGTANIEFRVCDANDELGDAEYDVAYARFLLTHVSDPAGVVGKMMRAIRPAGTLVVEDIDFSGYFCYPENTALQRYVMLYSDAVRRRGGDPNIGPRLPGLLVAAGCEDVEMNVVQPAGMTGEAKLLSPLTMENIADAVIGEGLADKQEIDLLVADLYGFAADDTTVMSGPRIVQAWGHRPVA